jgi:hypothetical protein
VAGKYAGKPEYCAPLWLPPENALTGVIRKKGITMKTHYPVTWWLVTTFVVCIISVLFTHSFYWFCIVSLLAGGGVAVLSEQYRRKLLERARSETTRELFVYGLHSRSLTIRDSVLCGV